MSESVRRATATQIITGLPVFGAWVGAISEYDTPYGRAGARQVEVLWALRHNLYSDSPVTASTISTSHNVQPSVVTRVLAKLEASGFVERVGLARDRRASEIRITDRGTAISRYVEEIYYDEVLNALSDLSDEEVEELGRQAARLHQIGVQLLTDRKHRQTNHDPSSPDSAAED
jgi:DNA-binding MarR family transcriptional regulator